MGLRQTRSAGVMRLQALLLISHVAALAKRLIGEAARAHNLQLQLMSTNRKDRAEISVMTLATRLIAQHVLLRSLTDPWLQLHRLRRQVIQAFYPGIQPSCTNNMIRGETSGPGPFDALDVRTANTPKK